MANSMIIAVIIILIVLIALISAAALIMRKDLIACETNQNPHCLQYVCPDKNPATRVGPNGEIQKST